MEKYMPDVYQKDIYSVNYEKLKSVGIKCLLFDLDNTLVPYDEKVATPKLKEHFDKLKEMDFRVIIFSNSPKKRLKPFKEYLEVDCLASAKKPLSAGFKRVMDEYKYLENEIAIIGDQLMTDIVGGNKIGITTILVNPIGEKDLIFTKFNRYFERKIMRKLANRGLLLKDRFYE